jgi:polyphosphate kinase 2 (PPK2 family)
MLQTTDSSPKLSSEESIQEIVKYQGALAELGRQAYAQGHPVIIIFEGHQKSGRSESIRRLTEKLDPRCYAVHAIHSPGADEALHHYLWRFWRLIPEAGRIAVFDHSWYGRVLIDRVEKQCTETAWKRAYREINQFERQLVDFGTIPLKFWFQIDREEQLRRLEAHQTAADQLWADADNGWREQENWFLYQDAIDDMLLKTNTSHAPWTVVDANSKADAQIKTLRTTVESLGRELGFDPFTEKETSRRIKGKSSKAKKKNRRR